METQNLLLYLHAANVDCTLEALHKLIIQESMVRSMVQVMKRTNEQIEIVDHTQEHGTMR